LFRFARPQKQFEAVELLFGVKSSVPSPDEFSFRNHAIALLKGPAHASCINDDSFEGHGV
jgi:hypothetical protein